MGKVLSGFMSLADGHVRMTGDPCRMPNYRRIRVQGGMYFFTVNLLERRRCRLLEEGIDDLRAAFRDTQRARPFEMIAIVVLPEHLHCLWRLPEGDDDNADRWARIKSGFSRRIQKDERRSDSRIAKRERGIWQRRFWEHVIVDEEDLRNHIDYIHINPVKHGYVRRAVDWPYSSLHRYVASGQLSVDWACDPGLDMRQVRAGPADRMGQSVGLSPPYELRRWLALRAIAAGKAAAE